MWLTSFGMWLTLIVRWLIPFGTLAHLDRNIQNISILAQFFNCFEFSIPSTILIFAKTRFENSFILCDDQQHFLVFAKTRLHF